MGFPCKPARATAGPGHQREQREQEDVLLDQVLADAPDPGGAERHRRIAIGLGADE